MRRPRITPRILRTIIAALATLENFADCDEEWEVAGMEGTTPSEGRRRIRQAERFCYGMLRWMDHKKAQRDVPPSSVG